jgi:ankyrin repeat protein
VLLIEAGADLHARNNFGNPALMVALINARDRDGQVVRILLDAGADPDAENNYGTSAKDLAPKMDSYDFMQFLRA